MLAVDPATGLPAVLLMPVCPEAGEAMYGHPNNLALAAMPVAIPIGLGEASAIATVLDGIELERPTTHELMSAMLADAGARVERVEIVDMVHGQFCARIHLLLLSGELLVREGRPSDALTLALYSGAEIHVATRVIAMVAGYEPLPMDLAEVSDEAFGKWKM